MMTHCAGHDNMLITIIGVPDLISKYAFFFQDMLHGVSGGEEFQIALGKVVILRGS